MNHSFLIIISCFLTVSILSINVEELRDISVKLVLASDLLKEVEGTHKYLLSELFSLKKAWGLLEDAFYRPEFLGHWCEDPNTYEDPAQFIMKAFQRDMQDPFYESPCRLDLLNLDPPLSSQGIITLTDLLNSDRLDEVINGIRSGNIYFNLPERINYRANIKAHLRKNIVTKVGSLLLDKFFEQTGIKFDTITALKESSWEIPSIPGWRQKSFLSFSNAAKIFIQLPRIKFEFVENRSK